MNEGKDPLKWWQRGVVYQVYPRSIKDSNHDGIGDLDGIVEKMDYFRAGTPGSLGVDAIWLSPFYPSPMVDFGYDVEDYCDVDPIFGDLAAFDRLLAEAHQRGLKLIIDWVPNHTSDRHPWFIESRANRDNPKRDWYIWRDTKPDGSPPNNWGSVFGGPAWTFDRQTGQYFLHQFASQQPELNWRSPDLRAAMLDTLRFWLKRGVDGFRMDVIGMIIKDRELRDEPTNEESDPSLPPNDLYGRLDHIYSVDQDDVHPLIRDIRAVLDEFDDRCAIGELWGDLQRWVRYYGENGNELHLPFNFRLMWEPWQAGAIRKAVDSLEAVLPPSAWPNYVLGNHDQPRLATRFGGQNQARLAAMLLLTLRGTPTLYYGDELGMENGNIPAEKVQDPQGKNLGVERTRDVSRTPMQWDGSPNAGFSDADPWLPVSPDHTDRNVDIQGSDPASILNLYRNLLRYRAGSVSLQQGSYRALDVDNAQCYVFVRETDSEKHIIALNFSAEAQAMGIQPGGAARIMLSTHMDPDEIINLSHLILRPLEGVIIQPV